MWHMELRDSSFYIYDSRQNLVGYLDPSYGVVDDEDAYERIQKMIIDKYTVDDAFLTIPMVKFEIFDEDTIEIKKLEESITLVANRVAIWKKYLEGSRATEHWIYVSHTDNDMLAITLPVGLTKPTPLREDALLQEISPLLYELHEKDLL